MNVVEIAGYVIGFAGTVGFAGASLYTGRAKGVIELQQDEITALRESNTRLSSENTSLAVEKGTLESRTKDLQNMVQSVPDFGKLSAQMSRDNKQIVAALADVATKLADLTDAIVRQVK